MGYRNNANCAELRKIVTNKPIHADFKGKRYEARVQSDGSIRMDGVVYQSLSAAGAAIRKSATNGWWFWKVRHKGELVRLSTLKK